MKRAFKEIAESIHEANPSSSFAFRFWDGEEVAFGNPVPDTTLILKSEKGARRLLLHGFLGFGDAYTSGSIEVKGDLQEILRLGLSINYDGRTSQLQQVLSFLPYYLKTRSTREHSSKNVQHHYDRGNELYQLYLDSTLTYSCAYFRDADDTLEQAQKNKYDHIARKLLLEPGESLVDVGCGWGGMLIHAALNYGITGTGITLSPNQFEYGNQKIRALGLEKQIEIVLMDYRELTGTYDKFVSIGMFEHVGKEFIPQYMKKVTGLLKRGGIGLLHTIGSDIFVPGESWTLRYIFPGGYLPQLGEIVENMGKVGLCPMDMENLRLHYAHTLDLWAENYERNIDKVRQMYDETFVRMWRFFLNSSAVGFKYGDNRLFQIVFSNGLNNAVPITRDHLCPQCFDGIPATLGIAGDNLAGI